MPRKVSFWVCVGVLALFVVALSYVNSFHFFMMMSREGHYSTVARGILVNSVRMHVDRMAKDKSLSVEDLHAAMIALDDSYNDLRQFEPSIDRVLASDIRFINLTGHLYLSGKLDPSVKKEELLMILMQDDRSLDWASRAKIGEVLTKCYEITSNEVSVIRKRQRELFRGKTAHRQVGTALENKKR